MDLKESTLYTDLPAPGYSTVPSIELYRGGFYVAGFWGPRAEEPGAAADRLLRFLQQLKRIDPILEAWYLPVSRPGADRIQVPQTEAALRQLVERQLEWVRRGKSDEAALGLGAMIGVWAGDYSISAGLNIRVGYTDARIGNAVVLTLPSILNAIFADLASSSEVLEAVVSCWDPDRAVLRPRGVTRNEKVLAVKPGQVISDDTMRDQFPNWMTYQRNSALLLGGPFASSQGGPST